MKEKERDLEDPILVAEKWWYLSRIQRTIRSYYKKCNGSDSLKEGKLVDTTKRIRRDNPLFWTIINTDAQLLRGRDIRQKVDELLKNDPGLQEKTPEEQKKTAEEALIKEFWELSRKAPRELKLLEELLFDE